MPSYLAVLSGRFIENNKKIDKLTELSISMLEGGVHDQRSSLRKCISAAMHGGRTVANSQVSMRLKAVVEQLRREPQADLLKEVAFMEGSDSFQSFKAKIALSVAMRTDKAVRLYYTGPIPSSTAMI